MLASYSQTLHALRTKLQALASAATEVNEGSLSTRARMVAEDVGQRRFQIAVVGEFKAGKSTLINAIVGRDVLPVASRECTAVITRIRRTLADRGEQEGVTLLLRGGRMVEVGQDRLQEVLTVGHAEVEGLPVEEAEIRLDRPGWDSDAVELVDTPGVGAAGIVRERATLGYLPRADAIIMMTRADQLLSESEMTFLRERVHSEDRARVFFVINFADRITSQRDRDDVLDRAQKRLGGLVQRGRPWLISAQQAVEAREDRDEAALQASGLTPFLRELQHFIESERAAAEIAREEAQVENLRAELERTIRARLHVVELDVEGRRRGVSRIDELIELTRADGKKMAEDVIADFAALERHDMADAIRGIGSDLRDRLEDLNRNAKQAEHDPRSIRERSLEVSDDVAGRGLARLSNLAREHSTRIQRSTAERLRTLVDRIAADLDGAPPLPALRKLDLADIVRVHSVEEEVSERIEGGQRRPATPHAAAQRSLIGGGICALIGGALLGPMGFWAGMMIGAGLGIGQAEESSTTHKLFDTVKKLVSRQQVDVSRAVGEIAAMLSERTRFALQAISRHIVDGVEGTARGKIEELVCRKNNLLSEKGADPEELERLRLVLARLSPGSSS